MKESLININGKLDKQEAITLLCKYSIVILLFIVALFILSPNAKADYIISAADGNVNIHFDTNAESVPTMNLNIQDFNVHMGYTNYSANLNTPTVNPIILGLELIMLLFGIMLAVKSITMFGNKNP